MTPSDSTPGCPQGQKAILVVGEQPSTVAEQKWDEDSMFICLSRSAQELLDEASGADSDGFRPAAGARSRAVLMGVLYRPFPRCPRARGGSWVKRERPGWWVPRLPAISERSGWEVRRRIRQADRFALGGRQVPVRCRDKGLLVVRSSDEFSGDDGYRPRMGSRRRVLLSARSGEAVDPGLRCRARPGKASVLIADPLTRHGSA